MKKLLPRPVIVILSILVVVMLWLAFRPELLFVNKNVDEPFPEATATTLTGHL